MKIDKKYLGLILLIGILTLSFVSKKKLKGSVDVLPLQPGEYPVPGTDYFPSDVPDSQN